MWINSSGWRLLVLPFVPLLIFFMFSVHHILHDVFCILLGQFFGRPSRVLLWNIAFMTLSEGWMRWRWMVSHEMGWFLKDLLVIRFMERLMISSLELYCCSSLSISMVTKSNNYWSLYLADVSTLNFIPVSVVICTHLRASVLTFLNSL